MDNEQTNYHGTYTGEQIDQAIEAALSPRVDKFNGRTGVVTPQAGDYSADKIGLAPVSGMTSTNVQGAISELFISVSEGKALIASAVTDKGIPTAADATFQEIHDNILNIETGGGTPENMHTITLTAEPPEGGTVSGGGIASDGMTVTVSAEEADGYFFQEWKEGGTSVGQQKNFSFQVSANRPLAAVFSVSKLPSGYVELEYIESTGTQWIDTGVIPNWNTKIVLDGQTITGSTDVYSFVFGSMPAGISGSDGRNFSLEVKLPSSTNYRYMFFGSGYSSYADISVSNPPERYTFTLSYDEAKIGDKSSGSYAPVDPGKTSTLSIALFAAKIRNTSVDRYSFFRLYSCKFYDSESLIRDYVPCIDPSGAVGLYDLINSEFYANGGTGSFTAGPTV